MVIIDTRYGNWSHLTASSLLELHAWAKVNGIPRWRFHNKPRMPHYDIPRSLRQYCIDRGAIPVPRKVFVRFLKKHY